MLDLRRSTQFKRDVRLCVKRGYDIDLLSQVIDILRIPAPLPKEYKDHPLKGNYAGYMECHILPDWLLIYKQTETELRLNRTGTHADLLGE